MRILCFFWQQWLTEGYSWLSSLDYWGYPAFISIYVLATLIGLPAIFLFLIAGSLFGFLPGVMIVSFADTLSIAICYFLGRTVAHKTVKKWIAQRPQWGKLDRAVAKKGWKIVFLTRLSPIVPSNLLNYGFSITRINFWQYLFVSWLGMLPVISLYVYLASVGSNLVAGNNAPKQMAASILGGITTVAAIAYTTKLMHHSFSERSPKPQKSREKEKVSR